MGSNTESLRDLAARASVLLAELTAAVAEIHAVAADGPVEEQPRPVARSLLTVGQAAEASGLSRSAVYSLIGSRALGSVRIGSRCRVPTVAIDAYVAGLRGAA